MFITLQFRVLRFLESSLHLTQREPSKSLRVSLDGVNYCLNALVAKGLVKMQNFKKNNHNWAYAYLLTTDGMAKKKALKGSFLRWKIREYQELKTEIELLRFEVN